VADCDVAKRYQRRKKVQQRWQIRFEPENHRTPSARQTAINGKGKLNISIPSKSWVVT
jgi:hypothetical protein